MKLWQNRKGIELSINFIVMLILALAVFSGGIMFATKFFGHAEKVRASMDAQTEKQIEKLLDSGSPVVIPINTKEQYWPNWRPLCISSFQLNRKSLFHSKKNCAPGFLLKLIFLFLSIKLLRFPLLSLSQFI